MTTSKVESDSLLSGVEKVLRERFKEEGSGRRLVPSTAQAARSSDRLDELVLPAEMRPKMPLTKDKYVVRENPHLVQWERVTRQFLRQLSPRHEHRVAAVMVYEWATGIKIAELMEQGGSASNDLRKINQVLAFYFGKPYATYIMGRKVPKCYRVKMGYLITRHRPMTLTLYAEYAEKTLSP